MLRLELLIACLLAIAYTAEGCGGTRSQAEFPNGDPRNCIVSPNHPNKYGKNEQCEYNFIPMEGCSTRIVFTQFEVEYNKRRSCPNTASYSCNKDWFTVRQDDGSDKRYCGTIPACHVTNRVSFRSDNRNNRNSYRGYQFCYTWFPRDIFGPNQKQFIAENQCGYKGLEEVNNAADLEEFRKAIKAAFTVSNTNPYLPGKANYYDVWTANTIGNSCQVVRMTNSGDTATLVQENCNKPKIWTICAEPQGACEPLTKPADVLCDNTPLQ